MIIIKSDAQTGPSNIFSYCRSENRGGPCFKTLDCWHNHFKVEEFLRKEITHEEWEQAFNRPAKPKVLSLLELIEQAKKSGTEGGRLLFGY